MADTNDQPSRTQWWNDDENATNAAIRIEERLAQLDQRICHQNKMQRIEFALQNTDKFSFRVNHPAFEVSLLPIADSTRSFKVSDLHSPKLVEKILYEFRAGERARIKFTHIDASQKEFTEAVDAFRESLVHQIHRLTGTKPYVEWSFVETVGKLSVWFSKEEFASVS